MAESRDSTPPEGISSKELVAYLEQYVEQQPLSDKDASEDLVIDLSPDGKSMTDKLLNARFRMADFLISLSELGIAITETDPKVAKINFVLAAIRFIRKTRELSKVEIRRQDAEVLLALFQLQYIERTTATIDGLNKILIDKTPVQSISDSLKRLEALSILEFTDYAVTLKERVAMIKQ